MPSSEPAAKPPSASLNVYHPAGHSVCRAVQNARDDLGRLGQEEPLDVEEVDHALPGGDDADEDDQRREPLAELLCVAPQWKSPSSGASSGSRCSPRWRSNSRTVVTSSKKRAFSLVSTVRG